MNEQAISRPALGGTGNFTAVAEEIEHLMALETLAWEGLIARKRQFGAQAEPGDGSAPVGMLGAANGPGLGAAVIARVGRLRDAGSGARRGTGKHATARRAAQRPASRVRRETPRV